MITIVGLGNPGEEYENTRHNAGRENVLSFAKKNGFEFKFDKKANAEAASGAVGGKKIRLILPDTYMNKSGSAVAYFIKTKKQAEDLLVIHDDLDLPLGKIRFVFARGSGGHKGVESIKRAIKTDEFARLRIGISKEARGRAKKPVGEEAVVKFVLSKITKNEEEKYKKGRKEIAKALQVFAEEGLTKAMTDFN